MLHSTPNPHTEHEFRMEQKKFQPIKMIIGYDISKLTELLTMPYFGNITTLYKKKEKFTTSAANSTKSNPCMLISAPWSIELLRESLMPK